MTIRQLGRKASVLFCTCLWLLASGCGSQASSGAPPAPRQEAAAPKQETAASKQATAAPEAKDAAAVPYVTAAEDFGNVTSTAIIKVPRCCCFSLSVDAVPATTDPTVTPAPVIEVQNANLTVSRIA